MGGEVTIIPGITTEREMLAALLAGDVVTVPAGFDAAWSQRDECRFRLGERHVEVSCVDMPWRRADPSDMAMLLRPHGARAG